MGQGDASVLLGKTKPNQNHKTQKKTPSPSKCIPLAPKSHVLCGRYSFQCVFCLMLVFQHPQLEERKVSTRLEAFTNHTTRARQQASEGPGIPPTLDLPRKQPGQRKLWACSLFQTSQIAYKRLLNSRNHTNTSEGKLEFITNQAAHSAATAPASFSPP